MPLLIVNDFIIIAIDCQWGPWLNGTCSQSCGTGTQINNRTKIVEEDHGGQCTGQDYVIEDCNTQPCPSKLKYQVWISFDILRVLYKFSLNTF